MEENTAREPLTDSELSAQRSAVVRQATAKLEADGLLKSANRRINKPDRKHRKTGQPKTGRPKGSKKASSREAVKEETGVDPRAQQRLEQCEALRKQYEMIHGSDDGEWIRRA